jgi:glutamate racemase
LRDAIAAAVGPRVALVDSAEATALAVEALLDERGARSNNPPPTHRYFMTDVPDRFVDVAARFLGRALPSAEHVDIS